VFSKTARWYFPGRDVQTVMHTVTGAAHAQGIMVQPSGPNRWEGTGSEWSMGVAPKLTIYVRPDQQGFWVDAYLNVDFGTGGILLLVMSWMVCFPVAIVYLILANQSFNEHAPRTIHAMYQPVSHMTGQPPMPAFGGPPGWG
jgi:hypothetical protein